MRETKEKAASVVAGDRIYVSGFSSDLVEVLEPVKREYTALN
jgi:hypothetical protein